MVRKRGLAVKADGFDSGGIEGVRPRARAAEEGVLLGRRERKFWPDVDGSGK